MFQVAVGSSDGYNAVMSWDMIGHEWAIEFLEHSFAKGSVRQAYLIMGPDRVGKRTMAIRLAQRLMCEDPESGPCRQCSSCRQIAERRHPDLHVLEAEEIDGTLKVDQVREVQRQIALAPYQASNRVVLGLRAHEMSASAANALLKTLEEPPDKVIIILTARSEQALLPTMVSRCELLNLRPVPQQTLVDGLRQRLTGEKADLLGPLAAGLPGLALALARDEEALQARQDALAKLVELLSAGRIERFKFVADFTRGRDLAANRRKALDLLEVWLSFWRDVMLRSFGAQVPLSNPDQAEQIEGITRRLSDRMTARVVSEIEASVDGINRNANLQLCLENLMLHLPRLTS
ncbi:MAG: DNA polymerase III subunit delta' [Anaerolineales bacterium]